MTHRFEFLDGLRGIAAILVVLLHLTGPLGFDKGVVPHGHLAVDFFFCLSGFVLTHAYGNSIGITLSLGHFVALRLIRLYPMIAVGVLVGTAVLIARLFTQNETAQIWNLLGASLTNLFFLPSPLFQGEHSDAWPANGPQWSLLFELLATLLFPWLVRMSNYLLIIIATAAGFFVLLIALLNGGVDGGMTWENWPLGIVRVAYPFTMGVLLYRIWYAAQREPIVSSWRTLVLTAILIGVLIMPTTQEVNGLYEAIVVLFLLPALLMASSFISPSNAVVSISTWLGAISYPVYAINYPIARAVTGILRRLEGVSNWVYAFTIVAALLFCLLIAWVALNKLDAPTRSWLTRKLRDASSRQTTV